MLDKNDKNPGKGCLIFALVVFGLAAIKPLMMLIFGASSDEIYNSVSVDRTTGDVTNNIEYLRTCFIILIVAIGIYTYNHFKKDENE